jgi:hypothetical protein
LEGEGLVIEVLEKMLLKREGPNEKMDIFTEKGGDME